jgi:predicted RNA-binding Zn-ribbon protein involved in translation (DUF1610 family)
VLRHPLRPPSRPRRITASSELKNWKCPGCGHEVAARATSVAHRCPRRKNKMTNYVAEKEGSEGWQVSTGNLASYTAWAYGCAG